MNTSISCLIAFIATLGDFVRAYNNLCTDSEFIRNKYDQLYPECRLARRDAIFRWGNDVLFASDFFAGPRVAKDENRLGKRAVNSSSPRKRKTTSFCTAKGCGNAGESFEEICNLYRVPGSETWATILNDGNIEFDVGCDYICAQVHDAMTARPSNPLLIITTCNHIASTLGLVESIEKNGDNFDVLFVDDNSVDGTPQYLAKRVSKH